jgi:long-chain fatty acid transport protein
MCASLNPNNARKVVPALDNTCLVQWRTKHLPLRQCPVPKIMQTQSRQVIVRGRIADSSSLLLTITMGLSLLLTGDLIAVGFRLPNQDPEAIARGNAFVATADNPSAIYYNPAGITQMEGQNISAGMYLVSGGIDYKSLTGAKASINSDFKPVPQFYYVASPKDLPLSFGLGVYSPYGLSLDWGQNSPLSTLAQKGDLVYLTFNPVVAWRINSRLSIGIGATINYSSASFERSIGFFPNDKFKVEGDGMDYGYLTTVDYEGTSSTTPTPPYPPATSSSASIRFPQFVVAGVSFRPTENWNLEFDLDWTDWDNVNEIVFHHVFTGLGYGDQILPLNYRSSFMYEFGITRKLGKGYFTSVGYFYSENSSPDQNFTPLIPDSDLHLGSIGFGHKGKRWDWAAAYHFGYNPGRDVRSDVTNPAANGTYQVFNQAINISATLKF